MGWLESIVCSFLAAVALAAAAWLIFGRRRQWLTATLLLVATGLASLLLARPSHNRPSRVVVILDQPLTEEGAADVQKLIDQLIGTGATHLALVTVDPQAEPRKESSWVVADDPAPLARLRDSAASEASIAAALSTALERLRPVSRWQAAWMAIRGTCGRVVVGISDPRRWRDWQPVDVDALLDRARHGDVLIDRVDLQKQARTPSIDIRAPLGLLADWPLDRYPLGLQVTVRGPRLTALADKNALVTVSGRLDDSRGVLAPTQFDRKVLSTGEVVIDLPLRDFRPPTGPSPTFAVGFVRCELEVTVRVAGEEIRGSEVAYLAVRRSQALIVCGAGFGTSRLLVAEAGGVAETERVRQAGKMLECDRARAVARFEFRSTEEFRKLLAAKEELPMLVVLHEVPSDFWDMSTINRLRRAVERGMHLVVVGPPPAKDKARGELLPGLAIRDKRLSAPSPRTADRTPILNLVFDAGRWGMIGETPGPADARSALSDALEVQVEAANTLIDGLLSETGDRLLHNRLKIDWGSRQVRYEPHADDRMLVRIAPALRAVEPLTDTLFASALELRLAALFAGHLPGIVTPNTALATAGLTAPPVVGTYPTGDPSFTPNQALVVFTSNLPQPQPENLASPIPFTLAGNTRTATAMPRDVLARLLLRGMTTAVIRLDQPAYDDGFAEMARPGFWPLPGNSPVFTFTLSPAGVVQGALSRMAGLLSDSGSWLTLEQASARLVRADPGSVFCAPPLNLQGPNTTAAAQTIGKRLAQRLMPLYRSPRTSMALAATEHGRFIDERVGPGLTTGELARLAGPAGRLDAAWKPALRWAAPQRFHGLEASSEFAAPARAVYLAAVDTGPEETRLPPWPLGIGGWLGQGSVLCLAYSPFETVPHCWEAPQQRIASSPADPAAVEADHFGPQRLICLATFAGRLLSTPDEWPLIHAIERIDVRGGVGVTVHFRNEHTKDERFWQPRLRVRGAPPTGTANLELRHVDWSSRRAIFDLPATAARALCGSRAGIEVEAEVNGRVDPRARFYVPRPAEGEWLSLSSLESLANLAAFSGGTIGETGNLVSPSRSARVGLLLGMTVALGCLVLVRGRWRWLPWLRKWRRRAGPVSTRHIHTRTLAEETGEGASPPRGSLRGEIDNRVPWQPGYRFEHISREAQCRFLVGIPGIPPVDRRIVPKAARLDLIVQVGPSMRACRDRQGSLTQVRFSGLVAQLLAELYWTSGATVRLIGTGLAGGPRIHGPFAGRGAEDGLARLVDEMARLPAALPDPPTRLEIESGTTAVWISDYLTEPSLGGLLSWGAGLADEDGRFVGVHVHVPEEYELVGFGTVGPPLAFLDHSGLTPADLKELTKRSVADLRRAFGRAGLPFAALVGAMSGQTLIEVLTEAGALGSR